MSDPGPEVIENASAAKPGTKVSSQVLLPDFMRLQGLGQSHWTLVF